MRYNPSVSFADTSLYTREAFPLRRGFLPQSAQSADCPLLVEEAFPLRREWADEGIGPYKECGLDKKAKTAGFPAVF